MKASTFLQIFLIIDVFFMGVLASIAWRHGYAHFRPEKHEPEHPRKKAQAVQLSAATRDKLLEEAQANFEKVLDQTAGHLQKDLDDTGSKINKLLDRLSAEIISNELEHYRTDLEKLRKQITEDVTTARAEVTGQEAQLKAKLSQEIDLEKQRALHQVELEKQRLMQQIDTKLADAVASFLLDTLQHNVDLGAQSDYLVAQLEEHKTELIKGVAGEASTP
jgi:F0F1-type ATP synthase membrane subunit b/b'